MHPTVALHRVIYKSVRKSARGVSLDRSQVTFVTVIHGHKKFMMNVRIKNRIHEVHMKCAYASRLLYNIEYLFRQFPGCRIIVYYDESTPIELLSLLKDRRKKYDKMNNGRLVLGYWKVSDESGTSVSSQSIMLARIHALTQKEFDQSDNPKKKMNQWVLSIDCHEELEKLDTQSADAWSDLYMKMAPSNKMDVTFFTWNEKDGKSDGEKPKMYDEREKRNPALCPDAGAFAVRTFSSSRPQLDTTKLVQEYMEQYQYTYGMDEIVLDDFLRTECGFGGGDARQAEKASEGWWNGNPEGEIKKAAIDDTIITLYRRPGVPEMCTFDIPSTKSDIRRYFVSNPRSVGKDATTFIESEYGDHIVEVKTHTDKPLYPSITYQDLPTWTCRPCVENEDQGPTQAERLVTKYDSTCSR